MYTITITERQRQDLVNQLTDLIVKNENFDLVLAEGYKDPSIADVKNAVNELTNRELMNVILEFLV